MNLSEQDAQLIHALQKGLPLHSTPFAGFGASSSQVIAKIQEFQAMGLVRRIGAVFNVTQLGYRSALCGVAAPPHSLDFVAQTLAPQLGITHFYSRSCLANHNLEPQVVSDGTPMPNLWFTLSVPGDSFTSEVDSLQSKLPYPIRVAPATKRFKVQVVLNPQHLGQTGPLPEDQEIPLIGSESVATTTQERNWIRILHQDFPLVESPYAQIAQGSGVSEESLLITLRRWQQCGALRRIALLARHQKLGFRANAMCTWNIPSSDVEFVGQSLAASPEVTHCYERTRFAGFPYNLFAMIHADTEANLHALAQRLSLKIGFPLGQFFASVTEYKKTSLVPFAR